MLTYSKFSSNYSYLTILIFVYPLSGKIIEHEEYIDTYEYFIMIRHKEYIYIYLNLLLWESMMKICLYIVDENVLWYIVNIGIYEV